MLNTAAEMGATSVFYHSHSDIDSATLGRLENMFQLLGRPVVKLGDESHIDLATGVCGSGIAFFYEAIQAVSDVGVKNGLTRKESLQVAAQLSVSAGAMLMGRPNTHPYQLRDDVCSPAGTTIFGIDKWHEQATSQCIQKAVQASIDRAKELSRACEKKLEDQFPDEL